MDLGLLLHAMGLELVLVSMVMKVVQVLVAAAVVVASLMMQVVQIECCLCRHFALPLELFL